MKADLCEPLAIKLKTSLAEFQEEKSKEQENQEESVMAQKIFLLCENVKTILCTLHIPNIFSQHIA